MLSSLIDRTLFLGRVAGSVTGLEVAGHGLQTS